MNLTTILAFAVLFWHAEEPIHWLLVDRQNVWGTLAFVLGQPILLGTLSWFAGRRARGLLQRHPDTPQIAQHAHHRAAFILRGATLAFFTASVFGTPWADWFAFGEISPALQILGDLLVLAPFFLALLAQWLAMFPFERALRAEALGMTSLGPEDWHKVWRLSAYLGFQIRHQFLVIAAPMTLILFVANLTRGYDRQLQQLFGGPWGPDFVLAVFAVGIFMLAPLMLIRIWRTAPLKSGALRDRLEAQCTQIGLRCRDILVWDTDGMTINAAVMGVVRPVRYVLLSDGLLATMSIQQIEAVFGHEAGHVRHHHMSYFLVFAFIGWLGVGGALEAFGWITSNPASRLPASPAAQTAVAVIASVVVWGGAFGWLSRRFEREADRFGAWCVTPPPGECRLPCSVHPDGDRVVAPAQRVCATGAAIFVSALDKVAVLNGIPRSERSWRHSSIASRVRVLIGLACDPSEAVRSKRLVQGVKAVMIVVAVIGSAIFVYYWANVPSPPSLGAPVGVP